jgi:hypothetical protein
MSHLTRDELRRWHDTGAAGDRERILTHLAACPECRTAYAAVGHIDPEPAGEDYRGFVTRGLAAYDNRNQPSRWRRALWLGVPAAAAAVLLVALNVRQPVVPLSEPSTDVRGGTALAPEAPAGAVDRVTAFRWSAPAGAARYRVTVRDAAGREMFSRESAQSPITGIVLPLRPGRYAWVVEALDASGQPLSVSRQQEFWVR